MCGEAAVAAVVTVVQRLQSNKSDNILARVHQKRRNVWPFKIYSEAPKNIAEAVFLGHRLGLCCGKYFKNHHNGENFKQKILRHYF